MPVFGLDIRPVEAEDGPEGGDPRLFDNARGVFRGLRRASPIAQEPGPPRREGGRLGRDPGHRRLQQTDKKGAQKANPVRDRGGPGEKNRHPVPAFQQRGGHQKSEEVEGDR